MKECNVVGRLLLKDEAEMIFFNKTKHFRFTDKGHIGGFFTQHVAFAHHEFLFKFLDFRHLGACFVFDTYKSENNSDKKNEEPCILFEEIYGDGLTVTDIAQPF